MTRSKEPARDVSVVRPSTVKPAAMAGSFADAERLRHAVRRHENVRIDGRFGDSTRNAV